LLAPRLFPPIGFQIIAEQIQRRIHHALETKDWNLKLGHCRTKETVRKGLIFTLCKALKTLAATL